ncbi:MAG: hypothetical protein PUG21_07385 [Prevotella sp.]|nr:hypothetical protein [Prevotella sp.]
MKGWRATCFMSFGLCDKMELRVVAIKVSRAIVGGSLSEVRGLSFCDDG